MRLARHEERGAYLVGGYEGETQLLARGSGRVRGQRAGKETNEAASGHGQLRVRRPWTGAIQDPLG